MIDENETKNCNCTFSNRGEITIELGCCDKYISLDEAVKNGKCIECNKPIMVFDSIEHARENGK